ncbi:hypothetical protein TPHV1_30106 [Treponema phagedenis]|uniref:Uncharacterized protein n=1 Tax=Treponema phagedenis TaxID=162 RepID=A0A0B7GZV2_TREPH|nr:hypothetical protein TPHV1_30106 [Treponema phagedenis]
MRARVFAKKLNKELRANINTLPPTVIPAAIIIANSLLIKNTTP